MFSLVEWSVDTVRDWAASAGHEIVIVVTQPGNASRPDLRYGALGQRDTIMMVVPTVSACEAALADLQVDLAVVFTFLRIPDSVAKLPRHGTVNVHPSLLPAYRGANGYRALYEGEPRIGASVHHLTPEFDAGPILAQASEPTPADVDPGSALEALKRVATTALRDGVPRALAGEPGDQQDPAAATDAPRFIDEETVLDLDITTQLFQCRFSALSLAGFQPSIMIDGERRPLLAVRRVDGLAANAPGIVSVKARRALVAATDGILELDFGKLPF